MGKVKATITVDMESRGLDVDDVIITWERNEDDMWWTTIKGENIRINKMSTEHLKNTMAHIRKTGRLKYIKDPKVINTLYGRKDIQKDQ